MWMPRLAVESWQRQLEGMREEMLSAIEARRSFERENERMRADLDWFKLRLSMVERERGQLIQAAIGVKISVPEFVSAADDPAEALNGLPNFSTVGGDAKDHGEPKFGDVESLGSAGAPHSADYSMMPKRVGR